MPLKESKQKAAPTVGAKKPFTPPAAPPTEQAGLVVDLSGVQGFEPIPAGAYVGSISKWTVAKSKSNQPKIEVQVTIDEPREFKGRRLFDNPSLQPQALFRFKQIVEALGEDSDGNVTVESNQHIGSQVGVIVVQENYQGEPRNRIAKYVLADKAREALSG